MVMFYALFNVAGMIIFATGATWFSKEKTLFIASFPTNNLEAIITIVAGLALMLWAAAQIVRELIKRPIDSEDEL